LIDLKSNLNKRWSVHEHNTSMFSSAFNFLFQQQGYFSLFVMPKMGILKIMEEQEISMEVQEESVLEVMLSFG